MRTLFAWSGSWLEIALPAVALAQDATDIEGSLEIGPMTNLTQMVFASTDWSQFRDSTDIFSAPYGVSQQPAASPGLQPLHGTSAQVATAQTLTNGIATVDGNCVSTGASTTERGPSPLRDFRGRWVLLRVTCSSALT